MKNYYARPSSYDALVGGERTYKYLHSISTQILSSSIASCLGVILGHPLETIKVRMQTASARHSSTITSTATSDRLQLSARSCFEVMLRREGVASLYKGLSS